MNKPLLPTDERKGLNWGSSISQPGKRAEQYKTKNMKNIKQQQVVFSESIQQYRNMQKVVKDQTVHKLYNVLNKPAKKQVRSFI